MAESYPNREKTLWEKEKLLVTSNFSFFHSVFKRLVSQWRQKVSLCGNGLRKHFQYNKVKIHFRSFNNPFPKKPWFLHGCSTRLLKSLWEKKKLLVASNFSFSHDVFYLFGQGLIHGNQMYMVMGLALCL